MAQAPSVLVVDDDPLLLQSLTHLLRPLYDVVAASSAIEAATILNNRTVDLVVLDLHLGQTHGQELIKKWKKDLPLMEIVVLSGQREMRVTIDCMRLGAADYLIKPIEPESVLFALERVLEKRNLKQSLEKLETLLHPSPVSLVGSAHPFLEVIEKARALKNHSHLNVLILGESGTGKEVLARFLHQQEGNPKRPFIVANMPAIPANLMEAELFGVEKGAFTDAKVSRPGKFELADSGDIFLDEIGDLPFELQSKILRVLQERQIQRVGSNKTQTLSFRTIAATNQPLAELMEQGKFREDLIYRLSDLVLWIPPLRERKSDIPLLTEHFISKHARSSRMPKVSEKLMNQLIAYDWPGNIRQLESTLKRALLFQKNENLEEVEIYDLRQNNPLVPSFGKREQTNQDFQSKVREFERSVIAEELKKNNGKKTSTIEALGLSKATFYRKLQDLGMNDLISS
ncbi:MAG: sigma-54-dependent Fis family transcriptional regulator [Proteobacteria bacterium]|nr:sigma-54-dependent Fis family transcriptional regulator [Pseudomonadota bacterium]NDC23913.1 sigma-54-dependent Fis family transcriptional regulator [Pseudomonadota bacterium]